MPISIAPQTPPQTDALTDAQLRAAAVPVSDDGGSLTVDGPLTDAELRASAVPIADGGGSLTVDAPVGTPVFVRLSDGSGAVAPALESTLQAIRDRLPSALVGGRLDVSIGATPGVLTVRQANVTEQVLGDDLTPSYAVPTVAHLYGYNAGSWDRLIGDATHGLDVDVTRVTGTVTVTGTGGTFPVTDGGGSLTVDAPVAAPVFVRLSDGSVAISPALDATVAAVRDRLAPAVAGSDAIANQTTAPVHALGYFWDGSQNVRARGRVAAQLVSHTNRTTSYESASIPTYNARAIIIWLAVTGYPSGAGTLQVYLNSVSPYGDSARLWTGTARGTGALWTFCQGDGGIVATAGTSVSDVFNLPLPGQMRLGVTHSNANPASYTLSYELLP